MLTLERIKQHLRIEPDDTQEDDLLTLYQGAARQAIEASLSRTLYDTADDVPADDGTALVLNDALNAALLLMIGHLYENREAVTTGTIATDLPLSTEHLIAPYRYFNV